ncbi:MAG: 3-hydroxybutyryl-CoA dehydrogenase, partial [Solirubrobacteraceae bacterium]|nr:3-hydroxybutyryl-CoA dehydrogenase [Solirubrobacteraceae bacterium]
ERLGIAGSGAIACGLAATAARHADDVLLWARSDASAARARATVEKVCGRLTGVVNAKHVRVVTDIAELSAATYIVEAITEDHGHKAALLAELESHAVPEAIVATTTSSLSVETLALAGDRPDRFAGLHVFNPVPRMKLVEVVFPAEASAETRARTLTLCEELGKTAIEVPDTPGFVVNRLLFPFLFGAVDLLESSGLRPEAIDECMKLGASHPMGPLELLDFVGLDVAEAIGDEIGVAVPERIRALVAEGATGRKAGRGLYDYAPAT